VTRERYAVLVFERVAPLRGGQGVRVTPMDVESSPLSNVEDAVAWYGDTAVPGSRKPAVSAPRCCTPTGPISASGEYRLVFSSAIEPVCEASAKARRPVCYCLRNFAFSASTRC
jgi:hypothetical protein